jgi:lipid A disaccharide synthetase
MMIKTYLFETTTCFFLDRMVSINAIQLVNIIADNIYIYPCVYVIAEGVQPHNVVLAI